MKEKDYAKLEIERHRAEVRQLIKWRQQWGLPKFQEYLRNAQFNSRRAKLCGSIAEQWAKGNRGEKGEWR
jgi:hypothetical protein